MRSATARNNPPASISPSCSWIADEDELGLCLLGVGDQPRQGRGVHHPGLVDQEDRAMRQPGHALVLGPVKL